MKRLLLMGALLAAWLPAPAVTGDGAMWNATAVGDVGYLPLEDLRSFYKLLPLQAETGTRAVGNGAVSLVFGPGPRDLRINGIRCVLTHPVKDAVAQGDLLISKTDMVKLIDPALRPTYIANRRLVKTIVIDPGHGGHDAGAVTRQVREADVTLLVASKLAEELRKRGYHAVLTHDVNRYQSDQQRVDAANSALNAVYVGLHLNSGRSDIRGAETYTVAPADPSAKGLPGNEYDAANFALALALQSAVVQQCGAPDGGCRRAHYSLLSSLNCPAAMVELGYATHAQEGALLNTEAYQSRLALALADALERFAAVMNPETVLKSAAAPVAAEEPAAPAEVEAGKQQPPPVADTKGGNKKKNGKRGGSEESKPAARNKPTRRK